MVSRTPLAKLQAWKARKGWDVPWHSSFGSDFNFDFGVTVDASRGFDEYDYRTLDEYNYRTLDEYNYRTLDEYAAAGQESMKTAEQPHGRPQRVRQAGYPDFAS